MEKKKVKYIKLSKDEAAFAIKQHLVKEGHLTEDEATSQPVHLEWEITREVISEKEKKNVVTGVEVAVELKD